ncbi:hypothetical protein ACGF5F_31680 [Streptomyces sp. NPDC047821]|uniref:hypothetical protein n=1 Tax=Streptomyces sp. NPDC047821 TaxID=3365488 RepID=UPI003714B2A8
MEAIPWFEHDDGELDSAQREFAAVLAARAGAWQVDPLSTVLLPARHTPYGGMLAYLDIEDPERGRIVLTRGPLRRYDRPCGQGAQPGLHAP